MYSVSLVGVLEPFLSVEGVLLTLDSPDGDLLSLTVDTEAVLAGRVGASESYRNRTRR